MLIFILIFIFGLVIGSFLNVCILRVPINKSIILPGSHCTNCNTSLRASDLIPLLSYFLLRGRCRYCGCNFSFRYALIEFLTAILFVWCYLLFGMSFLFIKGIVIVSFLIIITFIDYDYQLILDKLLVWFAIVGIFFNIIINLLEIWDMIIAALISGGLFLLIALLTRGGMGGGDIKFIATLGLWLGLKLTLLTVFLSFIIGGVIGAFLVVLKLKGRKDFIPFGPFIAIAGFISFLYGNNIITWYFQYMTR